MTRSARAAALRSTALATSLALAAGLSAFAATPPPSPKFHCRSRGRSRAMSCPQTTPVAAAAAQNAAPIAGKRARRARPGAGHPPACSCCRRPRANRHTGRDRRDVVDLAGRHRSAGKRHRAGAQAQAGRRHAGPGRDLRSGCEETRRMDHPAQRQQRRVGRALSRLHRGQSELAFADLPAPAPRGGAVGRPSRRRRGRGRWFENESPLSAKGKFSLAKRHDRARRPRQCRAPGARAPGDAIRCRRIPRARRSTCSAR